MTTAAKIKHVCSIYDLRQNGLLDLFYVPDVLYALGMEPSRNICERIGQSGNEGERYISHDLATRIILAIMKPQPDKSVDQEPEKFENTHINKPSPSLTSFSFDEDEYRDRMLDETYRPQSSTLTKPPNDKKDRTMQKGANKLKIENHVSKLKMDKFGSQWNFERNPNRLPPHITQTSSPLRGKGKPRWTTAQRDRKKLESKYKDLNIREHHKSKYATPQ